MSDGIKTTKETGFAGLSSLTTNLSGADESHSISDAFPTPEKDECLSQKEETVALDGYVKNKKNSILAYSSMALALLIFFANGLHFFANVDLIYFSELNFIHHSILLMLIVIIAYFESKTGAILDKITYPGMIIGLVSTAVFDLGNIANHFFALIGSGIVLVAIAYTYSYITKKSGLGGGIIKLLPMIGAFLGLFDVALIFIFSFVAAGITEIIFSSVVKGKKISCEFGLYICLVTIGYTAFPINILIP